MEFEYPVAIREYAGFAIVQTIGPQPTAAAADTPATATERLRERLLDELARRHPLDLASLAIPTDVQLEEVDLALYRNRLGDDDARLEVRRHALLGRYGDQLGRVAFPTLDLARWIRLAGGAETDPVERTAAEVGDTLRRRDDRVSLHRPPASSVAIDRVTVELEPDRVAPRTDAPGLVGPLGAELDADTSDDGASTLEQLGTCWSDPADLEASHVSPIWGRRDELREMAGMLDAEHPQALVLVGPPRVGKTSLVGHLAWSRARDRLDAASSTPDSVEPVSPGDHDIWFADPTRLTSLDSPYGGWRERCGEALETLSSSDDVLYLGRLVEALDAGTSVESNFSLAQFLKPMLDDRRLRLVAEATSPEWHEIERRAPGLARNLQVLQVDEPAEPTARDIVGRAAKRAARNRGIALDDGAIDRAWRLQRRFATEGSPLGRTVDFLERSLARVEQSYEDRLEVADVVDQFCEATGLPRDLLRDDRTLDLEVVRDTLSKRVMGQRAAIERVADVVGVTKADLGARHRPLGVFLFVGPTGVGKTELAKALAAFMFGDEDRMIRLDMSEYANAGAYNRLIGEGAGGDGSGDLTAAVRREPFSVVLLDEIEKAHAAVFDLLLQVFGEARLTDADGRTTRFQNTIVIMTSNLGGEAGGRDVGFGAETDPDDWERRFRRAAEEYFRPEFLGRIDQYVPFRPLPQEVVVRIAERELSAIDERLGMRRLGLTLTFDDELVEWVADLGWDERYGARPVERVVEQQVVWPLANHLADAGAEPGSYGRLRVGLDRGAEPSVVVEPLPPDDASPGPDRSQLADLAGRLAEARRDLQSYLDSDLFQDLVDRIESYETSSREDEFWEQAEAAAEEARRAERAREIVEPARELIDEVVALEDLAREAYHDRTPQVAAEIVGQVDTYQERVEELFLTLLTASYTDPDWTVLAILADHPEDLWRDELVELYRRLATRRDWHATLWQAIPPDERDRPIGVDDDFDRHDLWRTQRAPHGELLLLEIEGRAARPYLAFESGRHRRVTEEESTDVEVRALPPDDSWPHPKVLRDQPPVRRTARTWNFAENRIEIGDDEAVELDRNSPWDDVVDHLERRAWEAASWN